MKMADLSGLVPSRRGARMSEDTTSEEEDHTIVPAIEAPSMREISKLRSLISAALLDKESKGPNQVRLNVFSMISDIVTLNEGLRHN